MSLTPQPSFDLDAEASMNDDNDDGTGSNVVAVAPAAASPSESNFNLVYSDFNLASVSMPVFIYLLFLSIPISDFSSLKLFLFAVCLLDVCDSGEKRFCLPLYNLLS